MSAKQSGSALLYVLVFTGLMTASLLAFLRREGWAEAGQGGREGVFRQVEAVLQFCEADLLNHGVVVVWSNAGEAGALKWRRALNGQAVPGGNCLIETVPGVGNDNPGGGAWGAYQVTAWGRQGQVAAALQSQLWLEEGVPRRLRGRVWRELLTMPQD